VTDALRIDAGLRREYDTVDYTVDAGPGYPTGNVANEQISHSSDSDNAYTGAVDYELDNRNGVFARYTHGFKYPGFDDFRSNAQQIQKLNLAEVGYKHTEHLWKLYVTAFRDTVDENAGTPGNTNVSSLQPFQSKAYGLQLDGTIRLDAGAGNFTVRALSTFQHATYDDIGDPLAVDKKIIRQPDTRFVLNPRFAMPLGTWTGGVYGSVEYIGSRFLDQDNTVRVGAYTTVDAGVELISTWNMTFRVYGENLTDRHDPTEGDPRAVPPHNFRPILGRSVQFSAAYKF
jgi:outer membrane receptor protein involved in Fe transport